MMEFNDLHLELKYMIFDLLIDEGENAIQFVCQEWKQIFDAICYEKNKHPIAIKITKLIKSNLPKFVYTLKLWSGTSYDYRILEICESNADDYTKIIDRSILLNRLVNIKTLIKTDRFKECVLTYDDEHYYILYEIRIHKYCYLSTFYYKASESKLNFLDDPDYRRINNIYFISYGDSEYNEYDYKVIDHYSPNTYTVNDSIINEKNDEYIFMMNMEYITYKHVDIVGDGDHVSLCSKWLSCQYVIEPSHKIKFNF